MNTTAKAIVWVVVLGVVAWAGYAMLGTPAEAPVAETVATSTAPVAVEPLKIGFIAPLSGDGASYGEMKRNVVMLAVEEINAAGGVNGRPLEVIYEDGKCSGKDATGAAQKLVNVDKVHFILGGFCSGESLAAIPVAEAGQAMMLSTGSSSPDLTSKSRFFVRDYPSDATQGEVLAKAAAAKGWKKVAMIQEQLDYPLGIFKAFSASFEALGGTVVKEEFPTSATDFRSMLTKLKAAKPDALFLNAQTPASGERVIKQLVDLKWKPKMLVNEAFVGDRATVEKYKDILEGALAAEFAVDPANTKFIALDQAYKAKFGVDMPFKSYGQTVYDGVYLAKEGLMAVGDDGVKLADWFRTVKDWQGASGTITIKPDGDRESGYSGEVVKDGKVEMMSMAPAATSTPQ